MTNQTLIGHFYTKDLSEISLFEENDKIIINISDEDGTEFCVFPKNDIVETLSEIVDILKELKC